jgi:hypothetical protein
LQENVDGTPATAAWPSARCSCSTPKGAAAPLGDTQVRQAMRSWGYIDNKSNAVSAALTASRYRER